MFYFDNYNGKKILRSDYLKEVNAFFTTREGLPTFSYEKRMIKPTQTHTNHVEYVDERSEYPKTDALIVTKSNNIIYLKFADCTPIIFYDRNQKIGAVSHAGWRGTAGMIGIKTLEKMNSNPSDIVAVIGPAISKCCYEVSYEVRDKLLETVNDTNNLFEDRNVDLKKINACQLQEYGVRDIDVCPYCTSCDNDLFYSYRKENGTDKRHYAVLELNSY